MPPAEAPSRTPLAPSQPPQTPAIGHGSDHKDQTSASASPRDHMESGLAALQPGSYSAMSNDNPSEDADARNKSKRELSTSKRAAQNRAAQVRLSFHSQSLPPSHILTSRQRAFRQRKERYITELEEKVKQFETMETDFRSLQDENHQLREYILSLQSQLLEQTRDPSSAPSSPPRRRREVHQDDTEQAPDHGTQDRSAPPPSLPPSTAIAQSEISKSPSWSEHIDNLRQRYSEYHPPRTSVGGDSFYTSADKQIAKD
jgi:hypothetical protein